MRERKGTRRVDEATRSGRRRRCRTRARTLRGRCRLTHDHHLCHDSPPLPSLPSPSLSLCPSMSGKAPPRAPRALLNSIHASSTAAASPSSATPGASAASRLGATPPTGPRSLLNGQAGRGRGGKPYVNGHAGIPTGPAAASPPTGPSALKGKQVDVPWAQQGGSSGVGAPSSGCE